jgi:hypothetical protein
MSEVKTDLRAEVVVKKTSNTVTLDRRYFNVCEAKIERLGVLRRNILFVHFDGKTWNILHANEGFTDVKNFKLS